MEKQITYNTPTVMCILVLLAAVTMGIASCAPSKAEPPPPESTMTVMDTTSFNYYGNHVDVTKLVDRSTYTTCYVYKWGGNTGGISCVPAQEGHSR